MFNALQLLCSSVSESNKSGIKYSRDDLKNVSLYYCHRKRPKINKSVASALNRV